MRRLCALVPFVWEKMQISASGKNEIATLLPVTLHHVAALVQPSLFNNLRESVKSVRRAYDWVEEEKCLGFARFAKQDLISVERFLCRFDGWDTRLVACYF